MSSHMSAVHAAGNAVFNGSFRYLWPLFVAPALAAFVSDRTARRLPRMSAAGPAAATLAALPGLVALIVISQLEWGTVKTWHGVVLFWVTPLVAAALVLYAVVRAAQRQMDVARLFALAVPAGERLARAAGKLDLRVLELPTMERECFVAGLVRPTAFVSRGTLERLSDEELEAALSHERAHILGKDTLSLMALCFLRDLAPWGRGVALNAYRTAREAAADEQAAHAAGRLNLAAALLALARTRPAAGDSAAAALPMARSDSVRWRLEALLDGTAEADEAWPSTAVRLGILTSLTLLAWPVAQLRLLLFFCNGH